MDQRHTPLQEEAIAALGRSALGGALAEAVADKLVEDRDRGGIWRNHRDYCGHGLIFSEGCFRLVEVQDGRAHGGLVLAEWEKKAEFVGWLAQQSDYSLCGADLRFAATYSENPFYHNNQTLTEKRLRDYVAGNNPR